MATVTTMTGAAFDQLPEAEGRHLELLDGELIEVTTARPRHQRVAGTLFTSLDAYFGRELTGDVLLDSEFALGQDIRLAPDVAVLLGEHWDSLDLEKTPIPGAPDIAVEVVSPSERADDCARKVECYLAAGTQEGWQVWPALQKVFVHRRPNFVAKLDVNDTLTTPLLPGWEISVRSIFHVRRNRPATI